MNIIKRLFGKRDDQVAIIGHGYEFIYDRHWYQLSCGHSMYSNGLVMREPKVCSECGKKVKQ